MELQYVPEELPEYDKIAMVAVQRTPGALRHVVSNKQAEIAAKISQ